MLVRLTPGTVGETLQGVCRNTSPPPPPHGPGDFAHGFSEEHFHSLLVKSRILIYSLFKCLGWGGQRMRSPDMRGLGLGGWLNVL